MAKLFRVDGSIEDIVIDEKDSLTQMQHLVGGYIQMVSLYDGNILICNEEGKVNDLNMNKNATLLYEIGNGDPTDIYSFNDVIVGDAIICSKKEAGYEDIEDEEE